MSLGGGVMSEDPVEEIAQIIASVQQDPWPEANLRIARALIDAGRQRKAHVNSNTYLDLVESQRMQADAVASELLTTCGAYAGSPTDARTDAVGIVLAARFAPPLGDNHHNAAACPHCTPRAAVLDRSVQAPEKTK